MIQTKHITRDVWVIPRVEADLDLIAASPDLLAELERSQAQLVAYAVGPGPDHVDAQLQVEANAAAIAKARGGK